MNNTRKEPSLIEIIAQDPELRQIAEESIGKVAASMRRFVDETFGGVEKLQALIAKTAENLAPFIAALPQVEKAAREAEKSVFEQLPRFGWYFDPHMGTRAFLRIAETIVADNAVALDEMMAQHFRAQLGEIETELCADNPRRARILKVAFQAHRDGELVLAIPVFLAQTDGISRELLGTEYFRPHCTTAAAALIQQVAGELFLESALRSLMVPGSIKIHSSLVQPGGFNRHRVLHGGDVEYDTELNALRAVSLLHFVSRMNVAKTDLEAKRASTAAV